MPEAKVLILGGGMTGLAAGIASGVPILEATESPGGICSSYYIRPGESARLPRPPEGGGAYRVEIGGGHWIFRGDPAGPRFVPSLVGGARYGRGSFVVVPRPCLHVPDPF